MPIQVWVTEKTYNTIKDHAHKKRVSLQEFMRSEWEMYGEKFHFNIIK